MLDSGVATVIAAVIALLGTIIGLVVVNRRSARQKRVERFGRFETDRQDIYKTLWDRVEEINAALRRDRVDSNGFSQLVGDLNEFIIRNGAHVDESDHKLVNDYVTAVKGFHSVVSRLEPDAKVPYGQTQAIPPEVVKRIRELGPAQQRVSALRDELRKKVRTIIAGVP